MSDTLINLTEASYHKDFKITDILDRSLSLKLMEMGCFIGMVIEKQNAAPLNGPVLIKVFPSGNMMALRYEEAKSLLLSPLN
jgi:Fe2+ transport system protein FeoA